MDVEDDTIQIDLRVTLQNVRDDSEEKEKWRTQVIHTDHENHQAAYVSAPDPQADNPNATKLVRSDKPQAPYPSGIPQAFIDDVHAETNASRVPPRAWQARSWPRTAARRQALLASVSAAPMTAYDGASNPTHAAEHRPFTKGKGLMRTLYAVDAAPAGQRRPRAASRPTSSWRAF